MKKILFSLLCCAVLEATAQPGPGSYPDSLFSTYYHQRWTHFQMLPQTPGDVIFIGNSITDGGEWSELFGDLRIKNRGISGDISAGVLHRLEEVTRRKPAKVFLMIGVNDLARNISPDSLTRNVAAIADYLKTVSPATRLWVQSILPVNAAFGMFGGHTSKKAAILTANRLLKDQSGKHGYTYLDLHTPFSNAQSDLHPTLTNDGLHLSGTGYQLWKHLVFPYVYGLPEKPALIPQPQQVKWEEGYFPLYACKHIVVGSPGLGETPKQLRQGFLEKGIAVSLAPDFVPGIPYVEIRLEGGSDAKPDQYTLTVRPEKITLSAPALTGIFHGIQTLRQLMRDGVMIPACTIKDWPAFSWRGYMVDVGRNFLPVDLLKETIETMSRYKLNIFHLHLTEDIAWRLAIPQFPQLTAPEHMTRHKGQFYTETDLKDLIAFCQERHITLVPEIDMPGHSAAFRRAMGVDMQSDSGLFLVRQILQTFCDTYDLPYFHIGADEVRITNPAFVPEVTALLESRGKTVIGWQPGGNFSPKTIRQLWVGLQQELIAKGEIPYIDSRHLYLNHMDPLESVTTIFHRKIGEKDQGDSIALGATLCMWHDRIVADQADIFSMNPIYPGILAFAERIWRGGGIPGWIANISEGNPEAFREFENRLLEHKSLYFKDKPFPYVRQSGLSWKLYGPYDNGGDLSKSFDPEKPGWTGNALPHKEVVGGTVVLRHWWTPMIKGAIDQPRENTTWYAVGKLWSDAEGPCPFWIGFNDLSRSPATDSPPAGEWGTKKSALWVNGQKIEPPQWKRPGQKGHLEIPLIDEGYAYRTPLVIPLKKGWNTVLVKLPVGSFKAPDSQNPVKWMFTVVPSED